MRIATPNQMAKADKITISEIGIPGIVLMENAALAVVGKIIEDLGTLKGRKIAVFAGKGNNGGDAFAVARHLFNKGADVITYVLSEIKNISGDAAINLNILMNMGAAVTELLAESQLDEAKEKVEASDLVVDGIFGTGLKGEVTGLIKEVITLINEKAKLVFSIDIPSGLCGYTGRTLGTAVRAQKTVTFALPKIGLLTGDGAELSGELTVADIGIPSGVIEGLGINVKTIDRELVSRMLPKRPKNSNKGSYGKVFIISGSTGMTGSGVLAAEAALRSGAGLVYLGVPASLVQVYDALLRESVTIPLEDEGKGSLGRSCKTRILEQLGKMSVVAIGPGLSVNTEISDIVKTVITASDKPLILDADALNAIAGDVSALDGLKAPAVITPHPGEMARLTGTSIEDVQNNRVECAREFASKRRVITVLKGSGTVVAVPDGTVYINTTGNPGMSTGGTGDVLTGIIAGLAGQGLSLLDAVLSGVFLHGLAGDRTAKIKGEHGLIAGDIVDELPCTIKLLADEGCI